MEDIPVVSVPIAEEFPMFAIYCDDQLQHEEFVESEINQLWLIHQCCATDIESGQYRQRSVTNSLGQLLYTMKSILASPGRGGKSPGRGGKWSKWLRERRISRASGDRWIQRYVDAFHLSSESTQAIPEPSEAQINALLASIRPRLDRSLTTPRSRFDFLRILLYRSGLTYDWRDDCIVAYEPGSEPAREPDVISSMQETLTADGQNEDVL